MAGSVWIAMPFDNQLIRLKILDFKANKRIETEPEPVDDVVQQIIHIALYVFLVM